MLRSRNPISRGVRIHYMLPLLVLLIASLTLGGLGLAHANGSHTLARTHGARAVMASFQDQGTVTMVTNGSAADLDGATNELASSDMIVRNIEETLVGFVGTSIDRYTGILATGWERSNGGKVWTFHLRHGVKFHSGREMTSEDVRYSLVRTVAAGLVNNYLLSRFMSHPGQQIKAVDRYTVRFTLDRSSPFFLSALANEYVCLILDSKALKAHEKKHDWGHAYATSHDLGTGPYTITSWQHSQQVVMKRFPGYWGGWNGPHFSKVVVRTVPESSTRRELVEKGNADLTIALTPQDYEAMRSNHSIKIVAPYATEIFYIVMTQAGPLKSPYARQAMSYAFNYDAAITSALKGYGRRAYGPIPKVMIGYDPHTFHYQTNLDKAKALLKKAGVKPGTTLTYTYNPGPLEEAAGRILQAQLQQIGLNLKLQQLDEAAFNGIFYGSEPASKRPNFMPFGWWPDYNDPYDMANILVGSAMAAPTGANAGIYHNATVDALLHKMSLESGPALIKDAHTLQDLVGRVDPPAIWLAEPAQVTVMRSNLKGLVVNPLSIQTYGFYDLHH